MTSGVIHGLARRDPQVAAAGATHPVGARVNKVKATDDESSMQVADLSCNKPGPRMCRAKMDVAARLLAFELLLGR
jgi:hypothetical protein